MAKQTAYTNAALVAEVRDLRAKVKRAEDAAASILKEQREASAKATLHRNIIERAVASAFGIAYCRIAQALDLGKDGAK